MKDKFINTLAERFADHETSVAPGTWEAISGQMAFAGGETLRQALQEKFSGHEAPVDPHVWVGISNQLGHGAAAGVGSGAGLWAAGIAATLVAGGFLFYSLSGSEISTALPAKPKEPAPVMVDAAITSLPEATSGTLSTTSASIQSESKPLAVPDPKLDQAAAKSPIVPLPKTGVDPTLIDHTSSNSTEGPKVVMNVLQGIVDTYVTSAKVVVTEPVPPPTQAEMPSKEVHPQHEEQTAGDVAVQEEYLAPVILEEVSPEIFIPTAFSPNGDGANDEFTVSCKRYEKALVRIFSATNNSLVFSADNLEAKWNGRVMNSGQPCEPGMYFYALEVTGTDGRTWSKGEVVRLFR